MYLWDFLQPHTSGQGGFGPNDAHGELSHEHTTPHSSHVPLLLTENFTTHSATPSRPIVSALASDQRTPNRGEQGVDAGMLVLILLKQHLMDLPMSLERVQYIQHYWWTMSSFK